MRQLKHQHAAAQRMLVEKSQHLDTAINNMTRGLLLFNATGHLVICNQGYLDMFALSPDVVKPGCQLYRKQLGSFVGDVDAYCAKFLNPQNDEIQQTVIDTPDGRRIRLVYKRSPDGGWATTLEDITERSRFEARIKHLAHYDALTDLPNRARWSTACTRRCVRPSNVTAKASAATPRSGSRSRRATART